MIKTRLVGLLSQSKKYIAFTVLWQWLALLTQILAVFTMAGLLEQVVFGTCTRQDVVRAGLIFVLDTSETGQGLVSCLCGCKACPAGKNLRKNASAGGLL